MEKMSKFNIPKNKKYLSNLHKKERHMFNVWTIIMQSLNIKEWKLLELQQITQTRNHLSNSNKKSLSSRPLKDEKKYSWNVYKIEGAHLQCVNNNYVKYEYKGMNTAGVTNYTK